MSPCPIGIDAPASGPCVGLYVDMGPAACVGLEYDVYDCLVSLRCDVADFTQSYSKVALR